MKEGPDIAALAGAMGDPARANMLTALMTGKALTATELAAEAGVTAQTASAHLAKLQQHGLIIQKKQGRHRYFTLAHDDVARVLEGLMGLAARMGHLRTRPGPRDAALRHARVCYNHLAGETGVRLFEALVQGGHLRLTEALPELTPKGAETMQRLGLDPAALHRAKAPLCRECLDWSERKSHLAGSLGRALLGHIETQGWARRDSKTRVVTFSAHGQQLFQQFLMGL